MTPKQTVIGFYIGLFIILVGGALLAWLPMTAWEKAKAPATSVPVTPLYYGTPFGLDRFGRIAFLRCDGYVQIIRIGIDNLDTPNLKFLPCDQQPETNFSKWGSS